MGLVTLCTDFGEKDYFVPTFKARLFKLAPEIRLIEISHQVLSHNLAHAAFLINAAYLEFPAQSVHLIAVNSIVPSSRWVAFKRNSHFFVCPDNGIIGLIKGRNERIVELIPIEKTDSFPSSNAPLEVAVRLAQTGNLKNEVDSSTSAVKELLPLRPKLTKKIMSGHIIHLDTYGNLISNLPQEDFQILSKDKSLLLRIGKFTVDTISESFDLTDGGDCIAFFNSLGLLQVTINLGKANELLGLGYGSPIQIEFFER